MLTNNINKLNDVNSGYRHKTLHLAVKRYTFFSEACGMFIQIDCLDNFLNFLLY